MHRDWPLHASFMFPLLGCLYMPWLTWIVITPCSYHGVRWNFPVAFSTAVCATSALEVLKIYYVPWGMHFSNTASSTKYRYSLVIKHGFKNNTTGLWEHYQFHLSHFDILRKNYNRKKLALFKMRKMDFPEKCFHLVSAMDLFWSTIPD